MPIKKIGKLYESLRDLKKAAELGHVQAKKAFK
jgi:hypothetical protein